MIQVYEYYISHHLSKAFESLFGSVTCLPGCFSLYRVRTADKGRPIIISNRIIEEYADPNVDTLHKKKLFSLGEDRFLATLLMKHFPTFKTKFCPHATAHTMTPGIMACVVLTAAPMDQFNRSQSVWTSDIARTIWFLLLLHVILCFHWLAWDNRESDFCLSTLFFHSCLYRSFLRQ